MLWLPKWLRTDIPPDPSPDTNVSRRTFLFLAGGAAASLVLPAPPVLKGWNHQLWAGVDYGAGDAVSMVLFAGGRRGGKTALVDAYVRLCAPDGLRYPSAELSQPKEPTWQSVDRNPNPPSFWVHPRQKQFSES